ncbi:MAG: hypothetical protein JWO11_4151, partial [Nocardioides sp.]|nr:hypothetical protein [Nocardioides sp.]
MTRYSDPYLCPDCQSRLPVNSTACPVCSLPLQGPLAIQLFNTLRSADELLLQLRASGAPVAATATPIIPTGGAYPAPSIERPVPSRGIRVASVPTILLGLGALCLLVAAVAFLAVAWSWLGVGGRTAVLVALTLATGGAGTWLGGRRLRVAAESLTTVALGLLTLDVVGADNAGWLGDPSLAAGVCLVGGALGAASVALTFTPRRLLAPQVGAVLGGWLLVAGAVGVSSHDHVVFGAGVLTFAALAGLGRVRRATLLAWAALVGGWTWWVALALSGLAEAIDHASLRELWTQGHGWSLLAASVFLLLPIAFAPSRSWLVQLCGAAAATLGTVTLAVPAVDDGLTTFTVVALACLVVWSVAAAAAPARLALVPMGPMALASLPVGFVSLGLLLQGASTVLDVGDPFTLGAGALLDPAETLAHPALLLPSVVALVVAAAVAAPRTWRLAWPAPAVAAVAVGGVGTLALQPVPLWTVTAALSVVATALVVEAQRRTGPRSTAGSAAGVVVALVALVSALPSDVLTTAAAVALTTAAATLTSQGKTSESRFLGGAVLPASVAAVIWSATNVAAVSEAYRAAPILLVVGLLAILLPRPEIELGAGAAAFVVSGLAVADASDRASSLAVHLTLAGALVTASAL